MAALATGKLKREPCKVCSAAKVDAHHENYDKPLEVAWLCRKHHFQRHKEIGRALVDNRGAKGREGVKSLNIRDFPEDLMLELKLEAISLNLSLREYVMGLLTDTVLRKAGGDAYKELRADMDGGGAKLPPKAPTS